MVTSKSQVIVSPFFPLSAAIMLLVTGCGGSAKNEIEVVNQLKTEFSALLVKDNRDRVKVVNLSALSDPSRLSEALEAAGRLVAPTNLNVERTPVTDEDMKVIGKMKTLTELAASETEVGDAGIKHTAGLKQLSTLHLARTRVSSESLKTIGGLRKLKLLNLSGTQVTGDLAPVAQLKELEWLLLAELNLADEAFDTMAKLPKLSRLSLYRSEFNPAALEKLQQARPDLNVDLGLFEQTGPEEEY